MDRQLLKACTKGDFSLCIDPIDANPDILLSTTPHENNCLHIAAMLGHDDFAKKVWLRAPSLFSGTNIDGETPLIAALMAANHSLALAIITDARPYMQHDDLEEGGPFNRMLLQVDRRGESALHHAMRNDFENLALELLDIEPRLSKQVTKTGESPMYMAARRGYTKVVEQLLKIPSSADSGPDGESAMHAAVTFGHTVEQLLEGRPGLAYHQDKDGNNPLERAVMDNNLQLVKLFLEYDHNLAYTKHEPSELTPFNLAAQQGYVSIAKEIMSTCPDSVYTPDNDGDSALINAISNERPDFIDYILRTPQLHRLINQTSNDGWLPLHHAADKCDPKLLHSLLAHKGQDYTAVTLAGGNAVNIAANAINADNEDNEDNEDNADNADNADNVVHGETTLWKSLKWNESFTLLSNEIPSAWKQEVKERIILTMKNQAIEDLKSLTTKYTSNTSLVAALLATITFAAAFTLPGGFSSDPANAGLPIFARKTAFQVFLISDTIAMCSSLAVAFLCILTSWEDLDILLHYRKTTRALMWCAYGGTAVAFGTGLFTVIAPNNLWLAILILVLCTILPLLTKIIGEWPILMVRYRLRGSFQKDLIPNI